MKRDSLLGYALLGLLSQKPMSGYALRSIFAKTAMGAFSDSPGAIYPALRRLEARGSARAQSRRSSGLRRQRVYQPTALGVKSLKVWLKTPLTRDAVVRESGPLMLRFAFTDQILGAEGAARFLRDYAGELTHYISELKDYLRDHALHMPLSGRLALECGIQEYEARLRWATASIPLFERAPT